MNFKKMITLIEFLALTGVMSVGFSTWVIVETNFPEIQLQVETENVFNTNEYLKIKNAVFSDYSENGFYTDFIYSDEVSYTGYLEFDIEVELSKCSVDKSKNLIFSINIDSDTTNEFNIVQSVGDNIYRGICYYTIGSSEKVTVNENEQKVVRSSYDRSDDPEIPDIYYSFPDTLEISIDNRTDVLLLHMKYGFNFYNYNTFKNNFIDAGKASLDSNDTSRLGIPFHFICSLGGK